MIIEIVVGAIALFFYLGLVNWLYYDEDAKPFVWGIYLTVYLGLAIASIKINFWFQFLGPLFWGLGIILLAVSEVMRKDGE